MVLIGLSKAFKIHKLHTLDNIRQMLNNLLTPDNHIQIRGLRNIITRWYEISKINLDHLVDFSSPSR